MPAVATVGPATVDAGVEPSRPPTLRVVENPVLGLGHHGEVRRGVVGAVPVEVVDFLPLVNWTAQHFTGDMAVLVYPPLSDLYDHYAALALYPQAPGALRHLGPTTTTFHGGA
jgi:hypothetical protein